MEYFEDGEARSFFCALDAKDLGMLRQLLDRESKKQKAVDKMLAATGVAMLKVD